jgi:hypothetical protein
MFDQLRQQSMGGNPDDDTPTDDNPTVSDAPSAAAPARPRMSFNPGGLALAGRRLPFISSLNPMQRFVLALMVFLNVTVLGCFALLAFGKIAF